MRAAVASPSKTRPRHLPCPCLVPPAWLAHDTHPKESPSPRLIGNPRRHQAAHLLLPARPPSRPLGILFAKSQSKCAPTSCLRCSRCSWPLPKAGACSLRLRTLAIRPHHPPQSLHAAALLPENLFDGYSPGSAAMSCNAGPWQGHGSGLRGHLRVRSSLAAQPLARCRWSAPPPSPSTSRRLPMRPSRRRRRGLSRRQRSSSELPFTRVARNLVGRRTRLRMSECANTGRPVHTQTGADLHRQPPATP